MFSRFKDFAMRFRHEPGEAFWMWGTGSPGRGVPDNKEAQNAGSTQFKGPRGLTVDKGGRVYVADTQNHLIRRIDPDLNTVTTIAGVGLEHDLGDGGLARQAAFRFPTSTLMADDGVLYVADQRNHRIRAVSKLMAVEACPDYLRLSKVALNSEDSDLAARVISFEERKVAIARMFYDLAIQCLDCQRAGSCDSDLNRVFCRSSTRVQDIDGWCNACARLEEPAWLSCQPEALAVLCGTGQDSMEMQGEVLASCDPDGSGAYEGPDDCTPGSCCAPNDVDHLLCCTATTINATLWMKARYDDQKDRVDEIRSLRYEPFESQWTANRTHLQLLAEQDDAAGLRELLCDPDAGPVTAAFFEWYIAVQYNCTNIGPRYYHRASALPVRIFDDVPSGACSPHPGCSVQHPDLGLGNDRCCGNGYLCKDHEGNCLTDSDCADGLVCGHMNCPWSSATNPDNCCQPSTIEDNRRDFRAIAIALGYSRAELLGRVLEKQLRLELSCKDDEAFSYHFHESACREGDGKAAVTCATDADNKDACELAGCTWKKGTYTCAEIAVEIPYGCEGALVLVEEMQRDRLVQNCRFLCRNSVPGQCANLRWPPGV
jgi:hypothetical protein